MSEIASFRDVVALWGKRETLAAEIGEDSRLVSKWWQRDSIPADRWATLLELPKAKEAGLTADLLAGLARRDPVEVA